MNMDKTQNFKFKVGILIQGFKINKIEKELIELLFKEKNIELIAICEKKKHKNLIQKILYTYKKNSILKNFDLLFFKLVFFFEKFLLTFYYKNLKELDNNFTATTDNFKKIIYVEPIYSDKGVYSEYNKLDYDKIINEKLDIVVRINVNEIFRNNKLNISKLGILSFHHGDNSWNRGGPPGFWETYFNKPQTCFTVQKLDETINNGKILFKGEFATKRFYTLNKYNLLKESNPFLVSTIKKILSNQNINKKKGNETRSPNIFKKPSFKIILKYILIKLRLLLNLTFRKFVLLQKQRWHVAYSRENFKNLNFHDSKKISNLKNKFFADPFVVFFENKHFIFVEDYSYKNKKGTISVIQIDKNDNQKLYENIIDESFHLSFPYVFEYKSDYYMIPETSEENCIKLYKCKNFPNKWEFSHNLISNIKCVDTIMLNINKRYYLITSEGNNNEFSSRLSIFCSDSPLGVNWLPHKLNPIYFNIDEGRNAGLITNKNNFFRVSQKFGINYLGDNQYGNEIFIRSIENITSEDFKEIIIENIKPTFKKKLLGIHSMSGVDNFTVFDYCSYD